MQNILYKHILSKKKTSDCTRNETSAYIILGQ